MTRSGLTVEFEVHIRHGNRGRRRLRAGLAPESAPAAPGTVPRVSRLMALAIHLDKLLRAGLVRDYADIARSGARQPRQGDAGHEPAASRAGHPGGLA